MRYGWVLRCWSPSDVEGRLFIHLLESAIGRQRRAEVLLPSRVMVRLGTQSYGRRKGSQAPPWTSTERLDVQLQSYERREVVLLFDVCTVLIAMMNVS